MGEHTSSVPAKPTVDPAAPAVVGAPVRCAEYWLCRGAGASCTPPTVAVVLTDVFGVGLHSHAEVKVRALSLDLIGFDLHPGRVPGAAGTGPGQGWRGMSAAAVATLSGSYGVALEFDTADVADLAAHLRAGDVIVTCLDTEHLRSGGFDGTLPGLGPYAHHAFVLTGLDGEAGVAFLNDPADPGGTGVALALDELAAAWASAGAAVLRGELPPASPAAGLSGADGARDDPWAGLAETVVVAAEPPGPARRLVWLPFAFVATAACPVP